MAHEVQLHEAQTIILRQLLFSPAASYTELQNQTGLASDHVSFHIRRLTELGLVEKLQRGNYKLTAKGKEYANRLDTDNNTVERQPKTAVIFALKRTVGSQVEYLFQERRKNPYFGFWGLPSGKIRWGETIAEAAQREAQEETGLNATFTVTNTYHEHVRHAQTGEIIEDKIFFIAVSDEPSGTLIEDFEGGHNEWLTLEAVLQKPKKYATLASEVAALEPKAVWLTEQEITYTDEEF